MNQPSRNRYLAALLDLALPALVFTIGLQLLRVFFPTLTWYLRDTVGLGSLSVAAYAFGAFLAGFLAAVVWHLAGPRWSLAVAAGGMAVARLAEQAVTAPAIDLWLAISGTALFLIALPILVAHLRVQPAAHAGPRFAFGVVFGLALDSAIKGATGTLDISWISGAIPLILTALLAGVLVWRSVVEPTPDRDARTEGGWPQAVGLAGLGPFLLLQAIVYQNQGWIAQASGMESRLAFGALMLGNLAAGLGVAWAFARPPTHHPVVALAAAAYLALAALTADREGSGFLLTLLVGQLLMGWGLAILGVFTLRADRPGLARTTVGMTGGMLLLLIMAFVYYVGLDIALPIPRASILPAAAVLLGASYLFVTLHLRRAARASVQQPVSLWPIAALFLLPVLVGVGQSPPRFDDPPGGPFRVMTYNIHSAYNTQGRQDPEAIARAIEANQPDVVALQEVSRGWLIDGSTDLPAWLSRRLGMPFLFRGTPDPVWGNAILSRYPILQHGSGGLPRDGTLLARGYLWADIDVGAAQPLRLINTHLHHIGRDSQVRQAQVSVLIGFWNDTPFSVLLGDLNAEPGSPEMEMLAQAGLADSWAEAGEGPGYTFRSDDPYQRIDWIWHTPDLRVREVRVVGDQASDHLGVVVRLEAVP